MKPQIMQTLKFVFGFVVFFALSANANPLPQPISKLIPNAQLIGQGRLSVLLWDVYDAQLFASNGVYQENQPLALQLEYLLELKGEDIAKRSIEEMQKQGFNDSEKLQRWFVQMKKIFPNIQKNDRLLGIQDSQGHSYFFYRDQLVGEVKDVEFSKMFFGIWLNVKTSEPDLRKQLLGIR